MGAVEFGEALQLLRAKAGLTQAELASRVGVTASAVGLWEKGGSVTVENAVAVERALDLEPGTLSRHLGYVPVDASETVAPEAAVAADRSLTGSQRRALLDVLGAYRAVNRDAHGAAS